MSLMWLFLPGLFAQELVNRTNDPSDAPEAVREAALAALNTHYPVLVPVSYTHLTLPTSDLV